jgi:cytoskeletal protein CcmA (bactofilin family)
VPAEPTVRHLLDSFVIDRFAVMERGLFSPDGKDIVIGQGATVVGGIDCGQTLYIAKDAIIRGSVRATVDVVLGSDASIEGDVQAGSNVIGMTGARVWGKIVCNGNAKLHGTIVAGHVITGGDVIIKGESRLREIHANGRIRVLEAPDAEPEPEIPLVLATPTA